MKNGPVVVEIPAAIGAGLFGNFNDAWQAPVADVGPTGEDAGKGSKYLVLPPGYDQPAPEGYIPLHFATFNGYSWMRAIPETTSPDDVAKAMALVKKIRVYRFDQADKPPEQRFIDIAGMLFDGIPHFDDTFYDSLARMVEEEPVQTRDLAIMGQLATLGIEKGKPFKPDLATRRILRESVAEAHEGWMHALLTLAPFWPGQNWTLPGRPSGAETGHAYQTADRLLVDDRALLYFMGCAPAKKVGAATFYFDGVERLRQPAAFG